MTGYKKRKKVMIIGFDGLSPLLVEKWIEELPTLKRFKDEGWLGLSTPPIPAQTPVAWTTFMTGKNPGKHGIYSFAMRNVGTYDRRIANPQYIESKTLWQVLSKHQKKIGAINVPMTTYNDVDGFMIPGFLSRHEGVPHPLQVRNKIRDRFGVDKISGDVDILSLQKVKSEPEVFLNNINKITDMQSEVSLELVKRYDWDAFMLVYLGSDRMQHFFWKYVDDRHPEYENNEYTHKVKEYYKKMDQIVRNFIDVVPEDTLTILMSDHGFCPVCKEVIVNNYLEELGYLKRNGEKIDFEESKAVSYGYGDLWLNVKGREPKGQIQPGDEYKSIVDDIRDGLLQVRIDGEKPFKDIRKKEDIYWGNCINKAPDLTVLFNIEWQAARSPLITLARSDKYVNYDPTWNGGHDGTHDPVDVQGIVGFLGAELEGPQRKIIDLQDLAPTMLEYFKVPIPLDMDGNSLKIEQ